MTSTVLRVKRRLEENPQDALVLLCKRAKTDSEEIAPALFVFRGTVENQVVSKHKTIYFIYVWVFFNYFHLYNNINKSLLVRFKIEFGYTLFTNID